MKNKAVLVTFAFFAAMIVAFSSGAVAEGYIELTVFPGQVSVCPCSAITPQHVSVKVKNLHYATDTYEFTLTAPPGWNSQIQPDITLASGEEGSLDLFLVNVGCNTVPGTYTATIAARSKTRGETASKTLTIGVLLCRGAELTAVEKQKSTCFEEAVPVTYEMKLHNLGKFEETFRLSASASWAGFSSSEITLNGGETKTFSVVLNPASLPINLHSVTVSARSTNPSSPLYYTPVTQTLGLDVKDCYDFTADLQPKENSVCFGKQVDYNLIIENTGLKEDTYSIYVPEWITVQDSDVSLGPGQKATVKVTARPNLAGSQDVTVTVSSAKDKALSRKVTSVVDSQECRSVAVIVSPAEQTVCGGTGAVSFDVSVKNTGTIETAYTLSSSHGTLGTSQVTLAPGETRTTSLAVDPAGLAMGKTTITVKANDGGIYDEAKAGLIVENCYSAELTITPEMQSICPYDSVRYVITLENTGKLPDTYTLRYGDETEVLELNSTESDSFELTFLVPFEEPGIYVVSAFADSDHVSLAQTSALSVKTMDSCYNAEMKVVDDTKRIKPCTIEECEAVVLPVELKNTGEKPVFYNVSITGPDWVYMEPTSFGLESGETGVAYLYLSPEFGTEEKTYTVAIKASSEYVELTETIDVVVSENLTAPDQGVSLNVSGGVTGQIVGGERPLWKTIIVAIIALVIIIILAVRFILLVRK